MPPARMRWRRLDPPGVDSCRLARTPRGWRLRGRARFTVRGRETDLRYEVDCDTRFRTRWCKVVGLRGRDRVSHRIAVDEGRWSLDDKARPRLDGCVDIDLAFTPATNLLPLRRLRLGIGSSASVDAAWLRFPEFDLRRLSQTYHRLDRRTYRYRSGDFEAPLRVERRGFVEQYGDQWIRD